MCRMIAAHGKIPVSWEVMTRLIWSLIHQNGGDGMGVIWEEEGVINGAKSAKWDEKFTPMVSTILMEALAKSDVALLHTRKASSGSKDDTFYTHPQLTNPLDDNKMWETTTFEHAGEVQTIEGAKGLFIHNGTVKPEVAASRAFYLSMAYRDVPHRYYTTLSDTQVMGHLMEHKMGDLSILDDLGFGAIMGLRRINGKGKPQFFVTKEFSRTLYLVAWAADCWMIVSSANGELHKLIETTNASVYKMGRVSFRYLNNKQNMESLMAQATPENLQTLKNNTEWIPVIWR